MLASVRIAVLYVILLTSKNVAVPTCFVPLLDVRKSLADRESYESGHLEIKMQQKLR